MSAPIIKRTARFTTTKVAGAAKEDEKHMHLMHRGRLAVLRGFHAPQHRKPAQPMPAKAEVKR